MKVYYSKIPDPNEYPIEEEIAMLKEERRQLVELNEWFNVRTNAYDARERRIQAIDIELAGLYQKAS